MGQNITYQDYLKKLIKNVLRNSFIAITEKYNSFKDFFPLIKKYTDIFVSTYNLDEIDRIGLRYVNNIKLGEKPTDFLKNYFSLIFDDNIISVESIVTFMAEINMKRNSHFITNKSGIIVSPEKETIYVLDFDAYYPEKTSKEKVYDILKILHKEVIKEFHTSIKDEYLDIMRG